MEIGSYVIVRARGAGVHAGWLAALDGDVAELSDSRRLWYWVTSDGDFLSGVARHGIDQSRSKIGGTVDRTYVTEVCEVLTVGDDAMHSIVTAPEHRHDGA